MQFRINKGGMNMSMISLGTIPAVVETRFADPSFKTIVLFCCAGLLGSIGVMTNGIDLGAGLM